MTGGGSAPSVWTAIGGAKSYSGALVSKIRLTTDAAATGEARFDEVKVFRPNVFCIGDSNTAGYASSVSYWNPSPEAAQRVGIGEDETHSYPHWLGLKYSPVQLAANRGLEFRPELAHRRQDTERCDRPGRSNRRHPYRDKRHNRRGRPRDDRGKHTVSGEQGGRLPGLRSASLPCRRKTIGTRLRTRSARASTPGFRATQARTITDSPMFITRSKTRLTPTR